MIGDKEYWKTRDTDRLFMAILSLKNLDEAERFFRDLMTPQEIETFSERFKVAEMLTRGVSYREIYKQTKVSTATVTRVNQWLTKGMDGYKLVIDRLNKKISHHPKTATTVL